MNTIITQTQNSLTQLFNPKTTENLDEKSKAMIEVIGSTLRIEMQSTLNAYRKEMEENFKQQKRQMRITFFWQTLSIIAGIIAYFIKNS